MKLTDTACRAAKPRDKDFKLYDGNGLYLLVTSRGSKLWRWKYRSHGVERKLSLGSYPEVSIKEAREQVMRERKLLAGGEDPSQAKKIRKLEAAVAAASTFRAIAEEYIAKLEKDGRAPATLIKAKWALSHLSVAIGNRPIREIAPIEIVNVMRGLADEDKLETARRVRAFASRVFRHAIATGRADTDPCHYLRAAVSAPRVKNHAAILDEVEIGALLRAARTYSGHPLTRIAILLSGPEGNILIDWHLIFAPSKVLEYVVTHELSHLLHRSHGHEFWNLVRTLMPQFHDAKAWLDRHESTLGSEFLAT